MMEQTQNPTPAAEPPCELCQDTTARKMAVYGLTSLACQMHKGENQTACLALIVPLESDDKNVDPIDVIADIMLLGDNGHSIDETAALLTTVIEEGAMRAAEKANRAAENAA